MPKSRTILIAIRSLSGWTRLVIFLSVIWLLISIQVCEIYARSISRYGHCSVDEGIAYILIGVSAIWVLYGFVLWIIRGFQKRAEGVNNDSRNYYDLIKEAGEKKYKNTSEEAPVSIDELIAKHHETREKYSEKNTLEYLGKITGGSSKNNNLLNQDEISDHPEQDDVVATKSQNLKKRPLTIIGVTLYLLILISVIGNVLALILGGAPVAGMLRQNLGFLPIFVGILAGMTAYRRFKSFLLWFFFGVVLGVTLLISIIFLLTSSSY